MGILRIMISNSWIEISVWVGLYKDGTSKRNLEFGKISTVRHVVNLENN